VGLYLNPPEHALVLSCDEESQIQALNRTQPENRWAQHTSARGRWPLDCYFFSSSSWPTFCSRPLRPLATMPRTPGRSISIVTAASSTQMTPETV
jgi:hypothetical protein